MPAWRPASELPEIGVDVVVFTEGGRAMMARRELLDSETVCWQATFEGEHPSCWDDGVCWETNADNQPSDRPVMWTTKPSK